MNKLHARGASVLVNPRGVGDGLTLSVGELFAIMFPGLTRGTAETTVMAGTIEAQGIAGVTQGPNIFYRDYIKGFKDGGEPTMKLRFVDPVYDILFQIFDDDKYVPQWVYNFPSNRATLATASFLFNAVITKLDLPEKSVEGENVYETDVSLKVFGRPSWRRGLTIYGNTDIVFP